MAELNEQQAQDQGDNKKSHRSRSGFWFGIIILLVVIGVAGVGFYFLQSLRDKQKDLGGEVKDQVSKQISENQAQITAIRAQIDRVSDKIDSKDEHFNKALEDVSALHKEQLTSTRKELTESIEKMQRQLGKTRSDWLIADAEYLLGVAGERLSLAGDKNTALEALEAADQRLIESGDTGVVEVRKEIREEIRLVNAITPIDMPGKYVAIQVQQDHIDELTLLLPLAGKSTPANTTEQTDTTKNQSLLDVIGVKQSDQPIEGVLMQQEAKFIHEQLRIKLEMVKIALVQRNEKLYQTALTDAKAWLEKHFAKNDASHNFAEELNKFSAIEIQNQIPDISASLNKLKGISNRRIEADKAAQQPNETAPKEPVEPLKPVEKTELQKPTEVTKPTEKTELSIPVDSVKAPEKTEPKKPVEDVKSTQPAPAIKKK